MWLKSFTQLRLRQWFTFQFTLLYTVSQLNQCSYNYGVCLIKCLYLHSFPLVALRKMEDRNDCRWPQLNAVWWGFLFPCGTPVSGTSLRFGSNGELVTAVHVHSNNRTKSYLQDIDMYGSICECHHSSCGWFDILTFFQRRTKACRLVSTCLCRSPAAEGAVTCPPLFWCPARAEHAQWPVPAGQPVSEEAGGRGRCCRDDWPAGGAVVLGQCSLAAAPPEERPPVQDGLKNTEDSEDEKF